jgi:hypothetical protein
MHGVEYFGFRFKPVFQVLSESPSVAFEDFVGATGDLFAQLLEPVE